MENKPQKIEGGWRQSIGKLIYDLWMTDGGYTPKIKNSEPTWKCFYSIEKIVKKEIEKAKAEAYRAGLDFQKQSVEMIEKAVRASERQRCVEIIENEETPASSWSEMKVVLVSKINLDQAKENLEQMK